MDLIDCIRKKKPRHVIFSIFARNKYGSPKSVYKNVLIYFTDSHMFMEGNYRQKSMCLPFILILFLFFILDCMNTWMSLAFILIRLYSLFLVACIRVCHLLLLWFLFHSSFLVVCIRVCHVLYDFHTSNMLCFILISVHPYFLQF